ncbi:toll/interleukin-1 receptor domain-containing protein [Paractinoplanes toevensis]|uniref:TIR domain-containing protein n=1 Tax=Paractinoplanes toevensis TaxID=571911 RepID=A0A919T6A8_9ACTN|nr:toll/interleukin-1 receptor domain-containing protein [Actinoplanes toevensis]GIM89187.1 hypothetical protein Ato02nite_009800 [Actinoplanes toevensis]
MPTPLQKRPNDLFVSYGHADRELVGPVVDWLRRSAQLKVWYDGTSGNAAQRSTELLAGGLASARGALFFLSRNWEASTWCKDEHEYALTERRANSAYFAVAVSVGELEIPAWFKLADVLDLRTFDVSSAAPLLRSLAPGSALRLDNDQDVYFAGPWSNPSAAAKKTVDALQHMGWRLVGDSPDHPHFNESEERISSVIRTAQGLVAVLPLRPTSGPHFTSPWILKEIEIAQRLQHPYLVLAEEGVSAPPELAETAFGGRSFTLPADGPNDEIRTVLQAYDDMLSFRPHHDDRAYSFFAASLLGVVDEMEALVSVVERTTNMPCVRGQYLSGQHAQGAIIERIRNAAFVIADVTDDNRNSLIEAGVARGAGTPLHLLCAAPADGSHKTRFMFQDMEVNWYSNSLERLGIVYRIAKRYRRRVLDHY